MRSIMHCRKDGNCYLCILLHGDGRRKTIQEHHVIFGRGGRKLSERYGLKVYLCAAHHLYDGGPEAVHRNADIRKRLCREAERVFEETYPGKDFRAIFGKSYREDSRRQQPSGEEPQRQQESQRQETGLQFVEGPAYELDW